MVSSMSKAEFLEELGAALAGRVSAREASEHIRYYEDYINTQVRMGKSEEMVVRELGEPRLLARNIAETKKYASGTNAKAANEAGGYTYGRTGGSAYQNETEGAPKKISGWIIVLIVLICLLAVLGLVFSVLSLLAPILLPVLLVLLLVRFLRKNI